MASELRRPSLATAWPHEVTHMPGKGRFSERPLLVHKCGEELHLPRGQDSIRGTPFYWNEDR